MRNILVSNGRGFVPGSLTVPPTASERFDRTMVLLCSWLIFGLYIDGWAHRHQQIETFFTAAPLSRARLPGDPGVLGGA